LTDGIDEAPDQIKGGGVKIVKGERRLNKVRIDMLVPWDQWNDIYNEVIDPLAKEGADLLCQVIVIAKGDAAIREKHGRAGHQGVLEPTGNQGGYPDRLKQRPIAA